MKKSVKIIIVLLAIVIVGYLVLTFYNSGKTKEKINNAISEFVGIDTGSQQTQDSDSSQQTQQDSGLGEGGSDGSSDAGSGSTVIDNQICEYVQISYAIKDFEQTSVCNEYQGETCINKTVNCTLRAENLDENIAGTFEIEFIFYENLTLYKTSLDSVLEPKTYKIYESLFDAYGEDAAREIQCSYNTLLIPKRLYCYEI